MDKIVRRFNNIMTISLFIYLFDIVAGLVLIKFTDFSVKTCAVILGSLMLIHGLYDLIKYLYDGLGNRVFLSDICMAVASTIFGIFSIFYTFEAISLLGVMFGIWLIIYAIQKIYYLFVFIKHNEEIYPLVGFITILELVMGVLAIINPFDSFMLATKIVGIFSIANALLSIMYCLLYKKRAKQLLKIFE